MNIPSTYLKFWWSIIRLDPRDKFTELLLTLMMIQLAFKVVKSANEILEQYKNIKI